MLAYVVLVSRVVGLVSVKLLRIDRFRFSLIALKIYKRQEYPFEEIKITL